MSDFWKVGLFFIAMIFAVIFIVTTIFCVGHMSDYLDHIATMH